MATFTAATPAPTRECFPWRNFLVAISFRARRPSEVAAMGLQERHRHPQRFLREWLEKMMKCCRPFERISHVTTLISCSLSPSRIAWWNGSDHVGVENAPRRGTEGQLRSRAEDGQSGVGKVGALIENQIIKMTLFPN
jgi:hypothetical protein